LPIGNWRLATTFQPIRMKQFANALLRLRLKARIRLEIEIEIGLKFNQLEERKLISSLVNFALIGQNPIQSQSQSVV